MDLGVGCYIPNPVFTCPKITKPKLHQRKFPNTNQIKVKLVSTYLNLVVIATIFKEILCSFSQVTSI